MALAPPEVKARVQRLRAPEPSPDEVAAAEADLAEWEAAVRRRQQQQQDAAAVAAARGESKTR